MASPFDNYLRGTENRVMYTRANSAREYSICVLTLPAFTPYVSLINKKLCKPGQFCMLMVVEKPHV